MRRVLLKIQYDGRDFFGYQKQKGKRSVQEEIEKALFDLTGEKIEVFASGRTDRGVHAMDQALHFDLLKSIPVSNIPEALNNLLPSDISVKNAKIVSKDFNARFDIKSKTYKYQVFNSKRRSALLANRSAYVNFDLDIEKMKEVAKILVGKHNFKGFCCAATNVKDFEREIFDITIKREKNMLCFYVTGNGFLYNMVRIIVGTLVDVGRGNLKKEDVLKALSKGDRSFAGRTMPPEGLFLYKTNY